MIPRPSVEGAYWIVNQSNGSFLGIGATNDGLVLLSGQDKLRARQTLADHSQMWLVEPLTDGVSFHIRNAQSGDVFTVKDNVKEDGVPVIIYQQTNNANQHWTFEWVDDADGNTYYRVNNNCTKKALTLTTGFGNATVSSTCNNRQQQRWAFKPVVFPPVYWISHTQTRWYLHYDKSSGSAIVVDKIFPTDASRSQLWFLESIGDDNACVIRSVENDNKVLDLSGSGTSNRTPVIAYDYNGGRNQQWKITEFNPSDPNEDRVNIVSALADTLFVQVIEGSTSGTLQAQTRDCDFLQTWRLHQYPFPSVYWTTLQNLKTGTFLKQSCNIVSPSSGMVNSVDFSVQWRFIPDRTSPHHYVIVNRATGWALIARSEQSPTVVAGSDRGDRGALWAVEPVGDGIAIVSTQFVGALDHYFGGTTIEAYPNNGTTNRYHHWISVQFSNRLSSFALVNSRTGHSLAFRSATGQGGVVMSIDSTREWSNQWYFDILSGEGSSTIYAIINKASGMVLGHWEGKCIEAQNDNITDPHHKWKLIPCPCGENYFQIQNISTCGYLEELVDNVPNANAMTPMEMNNPTDKDMAQCWELVFARAGDFVLINLDDDVLQRILPYFQATDSETLEHRIVKRAPGKEKKGKNKDAHIPQNPLLLRDVSQTVLNIFHYLINEWVEHTLPMTIQDGTCVSTNAREVRNHYGITIPQSLRQGSERDGWMRIDIQGTYETSPCNNVANIQGQWNTDSVFHVVIPLGVRVGVETIREAMRESLVQHTSIIIARVNSKSPGGGSKPNTTPRPPPGPPGGSGNGWVYFSAALIPILLLSPLGV